MKADRRVAELLDFLARGDSFRLVLAVALRVSTVILIFGSLYVFLGLLGEVMDLVRLDATAAMGAMLSLLLLIGAVYIGVHLLLIRADRIHQGQEQKYSVTAAAIILLKLAGELKALAFAVMSMVGCIMIWFGSHYGLPFILRYFLKSLPLYSLPPFLGGLAILITGAIHALFALLIFYLLAELLQMLRNYVLSRNIR